MSHKTGSVLAATLIGVASAALVGVGPSTAYAANTDFKVVFQANTHDLGGYSNSGSSFSTTLGMQAGTSPSLAQLSDGTFEAAFQANNSHLGFSHLAGGTLNTDYGMDTASSPAIVSLPGGGWVAAFQTNNHLLYLYTSAGKLIKTTLGVEAGTNPAIAAQSDGSYRVVFQDNNTDLAGYNSSGSHYTTTFGMNPKSSPSLAAKPDGSYEAALEANTNNLATVHIGTGITLNHTTLGMTANTSPAVAVHSDGSFKVVFEANTHTLNGYNSTGSNFSTVVGMKAGTSPSLTALTDGSYEAAAETNTGDLATLHLGTGVSINSTTLGMDVGTNPALAVPAPSGSGSGGGGSVLWGVDSAAALSTSFLNSITSYYGQPDVFARYLDTLTSAEVTLAHGRNIQLLLIQQSGTSDTTGYTNGNTRAQTAVANAQRLGAPSGVAVVIDLEADNSIDSDYIRGWYDGIIAGGYSPAYYGNTETGAFTTAYCGAVSANSKIGDSIVWTTEPSLGPTGKSSAPTYAPIPPSCPANTSGWQYGLAAGAPAPNVDTDEFQSSIPLW